MVDPKKHSALAASKKLMQNYLSELLTEEQPLADAPKSVEPAQKEKLDKLLQQASVAHHIDEEKLDAITSTKSEDGRALKQSEQVIYEEPVKEPIIEPVLATAKSSAELKTDTLKSYREGRFQAMFFDVAGLQIAVPLISLGGIHNVDKINSLMGKPDWFKGVMLHREEKINVVDTAKWVMPEKCSEQLLDSLNYQYIIMLNNSVWGLMAENLIDTVTLEQEDVKWLSDTNKRPWLAGLVKDRMCALVDVDAMIAMLNEGDNVQTE